MWPLQTTYLYALQSGERLEKRLRRQSHLPKMRDTA
jgi:hypothetical protein